MKNLLVMFGVAAASVLTGCGGGGDASGEQVNAPYSISLRSGKTQLPINIGNQPPTIGAYSNYTTTLYVEARKGNTAVPGGDGVFECAVVQGLDSGVLYYLNGKDEKDEDGNLRSSRSVVLGANSGASSFHFHAINQAGVARITCSVTNPSDSRLYSASVDIEVGAGTGKPASVVGITQAPGYLGTQNNTTGLSNNVGINVRIMDDANQPVPSSNAANLQVNIRPFGAASGARLLADGRSGSVLQVRTIGGVGAISLSSGPNSGAILLEFTTDRFDSDVSNGIQDPVSSLMAVGAYDAIATETLAITTAGLPAAKVGFPFAYALEAEGGVPPYSWSAVAGFPSGLMLDGSGVIQGTPSASGTYNVVLSVRDSVGAVSTKNVTISVAPEDLMTP